MRTARVLALLLGGAAVIWRGALAAALLAQWYVLRNVDPSGAALLQTRFRLELSLIVVVSLATALILSFVHGASRDSQSSVRDRRGQDAVRGWKRLAAALPDDRFLRELFIASALLAAASASLGIARSPSAFVENVLADVFGLGLAGAITATVADWWRLRRHRWRWDFAQRMLAPTLEVRLRDMIDAISAPASLLHPIPSGGHVATTQPGDERLTTDSTFQAVLADDERMQRWAISILKLLATELPPVGASVDEVYRHAEAAVPSARLLLGEIEHVAPIAISADWPPDFTNALVAARTLLWNYVYFFERSADPKWKRRTADLAQDMIVNVGGLLEACVILRREQRALASDKGAVA